jgi:PAS domain S-box-containing protein
VVALGASVLLGWALDIPVLKSVFDGLATMKPNTATCMILGGTTLAILSWRKIGRAHRFCAAVLSMVITALGALTLGEYFLGWNLGIDELLFRDAIQSMGSARLGRMSPATAFCLVLAGSALWTASQQIFRRFRFPVVSALSSTLIVIGVVACLGQISDGLFHFHLWNYFGMAVHTAAGFLLLGSGLLALAKSEGGMGWALDKSITGGFIGAIAIMVTAAGISWDYTYQLKEASAWVSHTHQVLKEIEDVQAGIMNLESSQRGYLILGHEDLLPSREQVKTEIHKSLENLRSLTADNPHQKPRLDELEPLIAQRIAFAEQNIIVRRQEGFPAAQQMLATGTGIILTADIKRVLVALSDEENSLLVTREAKSEAVSTATFLLLPVAVFLSLTVLSLALFFLNAGVTERELAEGASARLAAIVNSSHDAIIGKDLNSVVTSWNPGAAEMFGYSAKEMVGQSITRLIPPDREHEEIQIINRVKNGEIVEHFDTVRVAKDGHLTDIAVTVSPIKDKAGKIIGASKVARDIGERKQAEKALRGERDFISAVIDTVGSLVVVIDRQARIIRFNRYCEQLTGYSIVEAQGRNLIDLLIMPEERATTTHEFKNLCAGQFPNTYENHWVTKGGIPRVISWSNTALVDADGVVEFVIGTGTDITERKRAMESLVESEDRLRFVTDNARVGLVIVDRDRRYTYANNAYAEVLDLHESCIVGQRVCEVLPRIYEEQIRPQLDRAFAGERVAYELRKPEPDGDRHFAIKYEPTKVDGEVMLVIVVVTDITEIKRAEEAQRATEARYRTLFDYAPDGFIMADAGNTYIDANPSFCQMLGYSHDELIGLNSSHIVTEKEIPNVKSAIRAIRTKTEYQREWQLKRKDGSVLDVDVIATAMPDGNRLSIVRDITEHKRAEEALRESENQFRTMLNTIPQLAWIARPDGYIYWYNQRWYDYTNTTLEQMQGDGWATVHDPAMLPLVMERWHHCLATGDPYEIEFPLKGADGNFRWFLTRCSSLKGEDGKILRWVGTNTDVSQRREDEEVIRQLNTTLELRVVERTAELEAANKELEAFSYSVSHDLRAPLRAVDGFSQAVLEDYGAQLPEEGRRDLQTIREGAQRMGVLIDDLLKFSRLSRTPLNTQEVNTAKLVRNVLEDLKSQREGRQIEIRIGDLPECQGDAALLNQVWVNLISNALKYTRRRESVVIEIGCKLENDENVYFVRDNCAGFDMRYVNKLFGVFQRLHRADQFEGTGVGLAIVQRIINRHGGRIWAEATLNQGATFYFTLNESIKS